MSRHTRLNCVAVRAGSALILLTLCWHLAIAAPAPVERSARSRPLSRESMAGNWTMTWGGYSYAITLTPDGGYVCRWSGRTYVGAWMIDSERRFVFVETTTPHDPDSWRRYVIRLDPETMAGRVEVGSPGIEVRLRRSYELVEK